MNIYIPNNSRQQIGGGWTFISNIKKSLQNFDVAFVDDWKKADVILIVGITITDKNEIYEAVKVGKKIVLRVDNVPRKSRNRRCTPHERLIEFADLADVVVYQSEWAKMYCEPLCGDGDIIYNGVDTKIFYPPKQKPDKNVYLFAYHGNNELKGFWQAHYYYQLIHRKKPDSEFWFIYDFKRDLVELQNSKFDFWNGEKYKHLVIRQSPEAMADLMRQCKYLIYPSFADASPNIVLEARACGLEVINFSNNSGTAELINPYLDISLERMGEEYISLFRLLLSE